MNPTAQAIVDTDAQYVSQTYARFPLCIAKGQGAICQDPQGKEYIDFTSGIGVNALGFCDPSWVQAVAHQAAQLNHTSNLYYTAPGTQLAESLCKQGGFSKVFFANSGAEANEGAIKAARKYSAEKYGAARCEILTLENSFHGRTLATLAATGQDVFHKHFKPLMPGFAYTPANDFTALQAAITPNTCAILVEFVQGEGGVVPLEPSFVTAVAALCKEKDILLLADEVQTGMGRTGTLFAFQQFGVQPDIATLAKGLGGGLPIGAVLFAQSTATALGTSDHGSTFGANPICCAGANYVLSQLTPAFLAQVTEKGALAAKALAGMSGVSGVSGLGLMLGAQVAPLSARKIAEACLAQGLLILTAKDKIRLLPPLNIDPETLARGLAILSDVLEKETQS